jgi:hypothetical protein
LYSACSSYLSPFLYIDDERIALTKKVTKKAADDNTVSTIAGNNRRFPFIIILYYVRLGYSQHNLMNLVFLSAGSNNIGTYNYHNNNNKDKRLVHSTFRIKEFVIRTLEVEAKKKGFSLSSLVNSILENYVTSEMYFEELGFLLVSKEFLRKIFSTLTDKQNNIIEEFGKDLGKTVAKEYVTYFFPEVNSNTLIQFLDLWFRRFQSYQHRISDNTAAYGYSSSGKEIHHFTVNHDINNLNFSIALKAMMESLIEPIIKKTVEFRNITPNSISFSFAI